MSGRRAYVPALALLLTVAACETAIDPFTPDADIRFAVHGYLDSAADTQFVRVQSLRRTASDPAAGLPGVTVRSTGDTDREWVESVSVTEEGEPITVFWSAFRAVAGVRYEVIVERSGEVGSRARTTVPTVPGIRGSAALGDVNQYSKSVSLIGVGPSVRGLDVWYEVVHPETGMPERFTIRYGLPGEQVGDDWRFTVFLTRDRAVVLDRLELEPFDRSVQLLRTGVHVELFSDEWTDSSRDPGILVGHGFFASVGRWDVPYVLPSAEVETSGFVNAQ